MAQEASTKSIPRIPVSAARTCSSRPILATTSRALPCTSIAWPPVRIVSDRSTTVGVNPQLRHFVALAELGSFTATARREHIVQSGLSNSVQALKHEVSAELYVRGSRPIRLTPAG
ncbi:LysR family transcriptional regulator [Nocardia sp. NEAU-G5]|uniref:LysR family transcriptional regulator n=1 Tax=Nocardia albiluteola TaxID=2842303 RepID=A0ABS6B3A0_9NOCA|nr:LysR family transcriptional regulator [Nocardia albiluteola]